MRLNNMISEEELIKFQELYKNRFNKEISRNKALESGLKLISLLQAILKPINKNKN